MLISSPKFHSIFFNDFWFLLWFSRYNSHQKKIGCQLILKQHMFLSFYTYPFYHFKKLILTYKAANQEWLETTVMAWHLQDSIRPFLPDMCLGRYCSTLGYNRLKLLLVSYNIQYCGIEFYVRLNIYQSLVLSRNLHSVRLYIDKKNIY